MSQEVLMSYINNRIDRGVVVLRIDDSFLMAQFYDDDALVSTRRYDLSEESLAGADAYSWCLPSLN